MSRLALVLGTRPEIIKLSPIVRHCERAGISYTTIHTGQHYSDELDSVFFERLNLPDPDYNLGIGSGSHGEQTGQMLEAIEDVLLEERPETVLVQGDTNSVVAGALATSKINPELGHVEAGLRSFDREMPEEINRIVADHVADYLFAPTEDARDLLYDEGIPAEYVYVTGNTIVDAVFQHREMAAERSDILDRLGLSSGEFVLLTAHRAENVDDADRFAALLEGVKCVADAFDCPVVYPIHPRPRERIKTFNMTVPETIRLIEPLDFLDFLRLEDEAKLVLTDSGGVQEETCILGTPCVTLRDSTERPETVNVGANVVVGIDPEDILSGAERMVQANGDWENPFGDGKAADHIVDIITGDTDE